MHRMYIGIGLILGIMFSSAIFVLAAEAPIKLVIDNQEIQCDEQGFLTSADIMEPNQIKEFI